MALGLPVDIPAGEERAVAVRLRFIGAPGRFRKQLTLYAQDDRVHVMPVVVTGKVID